MTMEACSSKDRNEETRAPTTPPAAPRPLKAPQPNRDFDYRVDTTRRNIIPSVVTAPKEPSWVEESARDALRRIGKSVGFGGKATESVDKILGDRRAGDDVRPGKGIKLWTLENPSKDKVSFSPGDSVGGFARV